MAAIRLISQAGNTGCRVRRASSAAFLQKIPPMGIYETLYAFQDAFGCPMGDPGTHPWSQGFPLTTQVPGGPPLPDKVTGIDWQQLRYPKAWGMPALRETIAKYYRKHYNATIDAENVMIFAGGRPALIATLQFLRQDVHIRIASTEYTPYFDMLERLGKQYSLVESSADNCFKPSASSYFDGGSGNVMALLSNPCNPTGVTRSGSGLEEMVELGSKTGTGVFFDEAYELFHEPPVSALSFIRNIDDTNIIVAGAATKGLQAPGIRIGWAVASRANIETLGNFSSFGMGGVSHPSQTFALELLEEERVEKARSAIPKFYGRQRERYGDAFRKLGMKLYTGDGGFYHWCELPGNLTGEELNRRLFQHGAAILRGTDCDMARLGDRSPLQNFVRFSFGPLAEDSFDKDIDILTKALNQSQ